MCCAVFFCSEFSAAAGQLYGQLYDRSCRRAFAPTEAFHAPGLVPERFLQEAAASRSCTGQHEDAERVWQVLQHAPSLIPFQASRVCGCGFGPLDLVSAILRKGVVVATFVLLTHERCAVLRAVHYVL